MVLYELEKFNGWAEARRHVGLTIVCYFNNGKLYAEAYQNLEMVESIEGENCKSNRKLYKFWKGVFSKHLFV